MGLRESSPENNLQQSIRRIDEIGRSMRLKYLSRQELAEIREEHRTPAYNPQPIEIDQEAINLFNEKRRQRGLKRLI